MPIRELSQITFAFFGIFWPRTYLSLHFYCNKCSILLTTYPPLNANVICEGLYCFKRSIHHLIWKWGSYLQKKTFQKFDAIKTMFMNLQEKKSFWTISNQFGHCDIVENAMAKKGLLLRCVAVHNRLKSFMKASWANYFWEWWNSWKIILPSEHWKNSDK